MPAKAGWTPRWPHGITKSDSSCPCCQPGVMDRQSRLRRRRERQLLDKQYEIIRSFYPSRSIPPSPLRIERTHELKLSDELIDNLLGRPDTRASSRKKQQQPEDEHQGDLYSDGDYDDDNDNSGDYDEDYDDMSEQGSNSEKQSQGSGRSGGSDSIDGRDEDSSSDRSQDSADGSADGRRDGDDDGDDKKDKPRQSNIDDDQEAHEEAQDDDEFVEASVEKQDTAAQVSRLRDSTARDSVSSVSRDSIPRETSQATPSCDASSDYTSSQEAPSDGTTARESTTRDEGELPDAPPLVNTPPSDSIDNDNVSPSPTVPVVEYDCIVVKTEEGYEPDASLPTHIPMQDSVAEKPQRKPLPSHRPRQSEESEPERATSQESLPPVQPVGQDAIPEPQPAHAIERGESSQTNGNLGQQQVQEDNARLQDEPQVQSRQQQQPQYKVINPSVRQRLPNRRPYTQPRLRRKRNWQQQALHNQWQDIERQGQQHHLSSMSSHSGLPQQMFPPPPPGFRQQQRQPPLNRIVPPETTEDPNDPGTALTAESFDAFWDRELQKLREENDKRHPHTQAMPMQKPLPEPVSQQQQQQRKAPVAEPTPWENIRQHYLQQELQQREIQGREIRGLNAEREQKSRERKEREERERHALELQNWQVRQLTEVENQQMRQEREQEERDRISSNSLQRAQKHGQALIRSHTLPAVDKEKQKQDDREQMLLVQEKRQQERLQQDRQQREKLRQDKKMEEQRQHVVLMQNERIFQLRQQQQLQRRQHEEFIQRRHTLPQPQPQPHNQHHQMQPQFYPQNHRSRHFQQQHVQQHEQHQHHQQHQQHPRRQQSQYQPDYRHEKKIQQRYQHQQQQAQQRQQSPASHQQQYPLPRDQNEPMVYITRSERLVATPDGTVMRARQYREEARRRAVEVGRERIRRLGSGDPLPTVRPGDQKEAPDGTYEMLHVEQDCIPENCDPLPLPGLYGKMPCPCCNMFIRKDRSILPEEEYGRPEKGRGKEYIPISLLYDMLPPPPKGYPFLNGD